MFVSSLTTAFTEVVAAKRARQTYTRLHDLQQTILSIHATEPFNSQVNLHRTTRCGPSDLSCAKAPSARWWNPLTWRSSRRCPPTRAVLFLLDWLSVEELNHFARMPDDHAQQADFEDFAISTKSASTSWGKGTSKEDGIAVDASCPSMRVSLSVDCRK